MRMTRRRFWPWPGTPGKRWAHSEGAEMKINASWRESDYNYSVDLDNSPFDIKNQHTVGPTSIRDTNRSLELLFDATANDQLTFLLAPTILESPRTGHRALLGPVPERVSFQSVGQPGCPVRPGRMVDRFREKVVHGQAGPDKVKHRNRHLDRTLRASDLCSGKQLDRRLWGATDAGRSRIQDSGGSICLRHRQSAARLHGDPDNQ